jgi:hypothetical protein
MLAKRNINIYRIKEARRRSTVSNTLYRRTAQGILEIDYISARVKRRGGRGLAKLFIPVLYSNLIRRSTFGFEFSFFFANFQPREIPTTANPLEYG